MDYFFAQIEERENPQFKGKPIVVGADPKEGKGRGVVSAASYEARKYGIHSALPISKAYQLCPKAIFLPVNMELYQKVSEEIMVIVKKYSPTFEQVSLDEAYLDLSFLWQAIKGRRQLIIYGQGEELAEKLKKEILEKEKLTCTIGIGPNKLIAKMTSKKAKPNGLLVIKPYQVREFLEPLDIDDLPGIGPKTAEKLREIGIDKIKELKNLSKTKLKDIFGVAGKTFYERARGIDEALVTTEVIIKSIGRQITFEKDTRDSEIIFENFEQMIKEVYQELKAMRTKSSSSPSLPLEARFENKFLFKTITVICRFQDFETHTKSKTLKEPTGNFEILKSEAKKLLLKFLVENLKLIRLIGLRIKIF